MGTHIFEFLSLLLNENRRMAPDRGLSDRKQSGVKGKKVRLTYAFTSNADGSEKLPPFIIGKVARPRAFNKKLGAQLGFYYQNNAKAWMTAQLYQDWIQQWDAELKEKKQKILLFQDNFSGHIVPPNLQNIRVENFEPNLTVHVQPKDQGIIRCFKAHYRKRFIQHAIDRYNEGITPAEIYNINQLQAMQMAEAAWHDVDTTTIRNCWRKAGILPEINPALPQAQPSIPIISLLSAQTDDLIVQVEKQVEVALDDLVSTGALQLKNRMDIESLLNPIGESQVLTEMSDREIYQAIIDAIEARDAMDINGGDELDVVVEPVPTWRELLKAVSTIRKYIDGSNNSLARKIYALLGSFTWQPCFEETQRMKDSVITDFFKS